MRLTFLLFAFTLTMFSCQDEPKQQAIKTIPAPTNGEISKAPKVDKSKMSKEPMFRLVMDNPDNLEVGIKIKSDDQIFRKSKKVYDSVLLNERSTLEYSIDGKEYSYDIPKGTLSLLLNPSRKDYLLEEIVYKNNKRSNQGPFETKVIPIQKLNDKTSIARGPFKLIKAQPVIIGFELAPEDRVPEEIAAAGNEEYKRFFKLRRYWLQAD